MYSVYSTSKECEVAGIVVIDLQDFELLFWNRIISFPIELE